MTVIRVHDIRGQSMSEEIRNDAELNPEVTENPQAEDSQAEDSVAACESASPEQPESVDEPEQAAELLAESVVEASSAEAVEASSAEAVEASSAEAVEEPVEASVEAVEESVDLSHMSWEDRVVYYQSLGTVEGFVEALRLVDFHNPGDIQLEEVWGEILNEHGEVARELFERASRLVTSLPDVWSGIAEAHRVALENATDEGRAAINEVIGWIECLRTQDQESGLARLSDFESPRNARIKETLAVVATGNWRKVEQTVEAQVRERVEGDDAVAVEMAHVVADYALSANALDRAVEMMRRTSRKVTTDMSLKWRLAILSRDQQKWNAYVDVLAKELVGASEKVEEKIDIYGEMIRVYRDETKQEAMVVKTYEALLAVAPGHAEALHSLVEIYEKMRRWPDLIKVLESQAEGGDDAQRVEYYLRIAKIYLEKLSRKVDAIKYFENVLSVDSMHEESIEQLKTLYAERRDWEKLIDVHRKELQRIDEVSDKIALLREMADIAKTKLRNNGVSIEIWNDVLGYDAQNEEAISALEALYESEKRWVDLAGIMERRIELAPTDDEKFAILQKLGVLYSDRAGDNASAIATWRRVLAIDPTFAKGIDSLRKLLIEERDWDALEAYYAENGILPDLVKLFEQLSKTLKEDADKKSVLLHAAHVYEQSLGDSERALATLEKILAIDAHDAVAAKELVGYYESRGKYEELARMLEILHDSCEVGEERSSYGLRLAKLYETKLSDDEKSYGWYLKIVREDIHFEQAYDGLERMSGKTGHADVVVSLFREELERTDDTRFKRELQYRIGCLLLEYLQGADEAQKIFEELLATDPEDVRALGALERILEREGRFNELLEVNERRMKLAKCPEDLAETLLSGARIHENHLGDKAGAIESYERVCELLPEDPRPLVELHRLYAETESYESLARVIEKQLELLGASQAFSETRTGAEVSDEGIVAVVYGAKLERTEDGAFWVERSVHGLDAEEAVSLWFELGEVYRTELSQYEDSVRCYDNILLLDPSHEGSIHALESLLENGVCVDVVGRALSKYYASEEKNAELKDVLVKLADALKESADKISYYVCASQICSEILEDSEGAMDCLARAMESNPAGTLVKQALLELAQRYDSWPRVISILESVAGTVSADDDALLATQYALELSSLWETQLDNRDQAIAYGRKALSIGGNNQEVLDYLKETFMRLESWTDVIAVLKAETLLSEDDAALLDLNVQIASIQETYLDDKSGAIETLLSILEKHPENMDVMVSLDRLYVGSERWEEAVSNCERRLELVEDSSERDDIECHMASILSAHLNEVDRAFEIYSNILSHDESNAAAVSGLEEMVAHNDGVIVEQTAELLLPIYDAADNWERHCWIDEQLLRVIFEPERRRDLLHEIASLYEQRGEDHEKAYDAFARSLKEDLRCQTTLDQLYGYADVLDKWSDLVKVMEDATVDAEDVEAARNIRCMVAEIYREHLEDIDSAIATYASIQEQNPEDIEILDALIGLYQEKEAWKELTNVLLLKAKLVSEPEERKALLFQAATIHEEVLGDPDAAIAIHSEILADEAGEPTALDSLERLYTGKEAWADLLNVYIAKNEIVQGDEEHKALYFRMGELQETKLEDNVGAVETYQRILDIDPEDPQALEALDRLYQSVNDMTNLLDILQRREAISEDEASRVQFKFRQAECWYRNLDDCMRAIEVYREVFELDASHEASIASVEEIIGLGGEAAVEAAKVLVPVYQGLERWDSLVKVYEVLVSGSDDVEEQIRLLGTIGLVEEEMLQNSKAAFEAWYRALRCDALREESWQKVESLAETCECWDELVTKLDELVVELSSDATAVIIVAKHEAAIFEEKLGQPEKAIEALRRVLEMDSNDIDAIRGLDHLYEVLQQWQDLADLLHTEIDIAETGEERLGCYYRLGAVQEMYLENYEEAISSYNEMHLIVPGQPEAIESLVRMFDAGHGCAAIAEILEAFYRGIEDWEKLVELDLKYVEYIEDHDARYDKFIEIADVYLNNLGNIADGLAIYGRALVERPGDDLCLSKIDELSEILQDWSQNVVYYHNAVEACSDDAIKQDLMLRMAQTYDVHLADAQNAERCYLGVLGFDEEHLVSLEALDRIYASQERWQELVAIIRREIPVVDSDETRISLYMRLGAVLHDMLGEGDSAIEAYNEILNIDPSCWDALSALEAIYQGREDWKSLDEIFDKEAAASNDDQQRVELWGKRAQLNSEILNKPDDAVDLWYQVLDVLGDNLVALQNLEILFTRAERWADVADVLERQVPLTEGDAELQLETYRKLGRLYRDKLEDNERALDFWHSAHQVVPTDLETLRAIEALDEALNNPDELADILHEILQSNQLDFEAQLACAVKLAGVLDGLGRVDDTIQIWLYVVQLDSTHVQALDELERLYESEGRWEDVVSTLNSKIAIVESLDEKVALYNQIAGIWEQQVGDIAKAAAAYQSILDLDQERHAAFEALEVLYTNHEQWQELLGAYIERAEIVGDQKSRLDLLFKGARIAEEKLQQPEMAFAVLQSAIPENWKEERLVSEIERLAELTSKWQDLVNLYEGLIEQTTVPADALALHNTVARWYFHHLNNNEGSWTHFQYVLGVDPNNLDALAAMTEIFWRLGNWDELVNTLLRRLELTTVTDDRVTLFMELAKVFEEKIGDIGQAIDCYMQAFRLSEDRLDVMKELARIYEAAEQWNELVDILERECAVMDDSDEKIAVRFKIGTIWEQCLQNYEKAADSYALVIQMDETHVEALKALERVDIALERWSDLLKIYEYQLAALSDAEEQIAIYSKLSQVYEHHLNDYENAITSMVQVTLIDPARVSAFVELERLYEIVERWQDLIDILNTHINTLANPAEHVELYRKLGVVYRDKVADAYRAVESFQAIVSIVPNDVPALYALADLYESAEDYISAIDYLNRIIASISDMSEALQVHFRIGTIYDQKLQDDVAAEERYKICLDVDAGFMPAIDALCALYERHEDWQSLVRTLKQKVEYTRELDAKAQINCVLGDVSLHKIDDSVNAYAYYNEALTLQPDCVAAAWPLAEKCLSEKAYARALLLFEIVIKGLSFVTADTSELYALNYKAGLCCQNLAQHERALEFYRASYELNQDYAPTLMGMGEELLEAQDYDRAYKMFQGLLERFSGELTAEQVIQIYYDSAVAKKATGELALARQLLERILEADGTQMPSLELIIDVCDQMADWEALVYYMNIHMERQDDKDIKFAELMKIAKVYHDKLNDPQRQIEAYYKALEVDPGSRIVLNELLSIYHATGQWENAIAIIDRLCESEEDSEKVAKFYYTIAVIYRDELQIDDKAVEYFNKTLDENVGELRAFEAIDRILTASRDWPSLEQNYLRMIARVKAENSPEFDDTMRLLWYGLGEIYRTRLNEWDNAINAFRKASELSPNDEKLHNILSQLYIRMPDHAQDAIEEIRTIIDLQGNHMTPEQEQRNYRSLYYLYYSMGDYDKAWCISDITCARNIAMPDEVKHHDEAEDQLQGAVNRLMSDDVRNLLFHPTLSNDLNLLFVHYQQYLRETFCFKLADEGIAKRKANLPYNADQIFWRIFKIAADAIGLPYSSIPVYQSEIVHSGMRIANISTNAFVLASNMFSGRSVNELRFIIAHNLFRLMHFYMSGVRLGSAGLKTIIEASMMYLNNIPPQNENQKNIKNALENVPRGSQTEIRQMLIDIVNKKASVNTSAWLKACDFSCDRAALLLSCDIDTAARCIRNEDELRSSKLTADERIAELTKFAMSDAYFTLREHLGIQCYDNANSVQ